MTVAALRARMEHERPDTLTDHEVDLLTLNVRHDGDPLAVNRVFTYYTNRDEIRYVRLMPPAGDLWVEWGLIMEHFTAAR